MLSLLDLVVVKTYMSSSKNRENAQGVVEFALVLPVLLLIIFGIIEVGRLLFIYSAVATASREAVRYGSAAGDTPGGTPRYMDCAGMREAAKRMGFLAGVQDADIIIQYDHGPSTSVFGTCPTSSSNDITGGLDRVIVQVSATYTPILPFVNLPGFPISSQSARTVIKNIQVFGNTPTTGPTSLQTATSTSTPTATATLTATNTEVSTATATPTAMATISPTATNTAVPTPAAPVYEQVNWTQDKTKCQNITFTWSPNLAWATSPGEGPVHYQVYRNGSSQGTISPSDPNPTTWNTGVNLNNNGTVTLQVQAIFSGGLGSELLTKNYLCDKGNLEEQ